MRNVPSTVVDVDIHSDVCVGSFTTPFYTAKIHAHKYVVIYITTPSIPSLWATIHVHTTAGWLSTIILAVRK